MPTVSDRPLQLFLTLSFRRALECSAAEARERELAIWHQAQLNEAKARDEFKHRRDHPPNTGESNLPRLIFTNREATRSWLQGRQDSYFFALVASFWSVRDY